MVLLRFSIRDVLWLTAVAALAVGWWLGNARLTAERDSFRIRAVELEGSSAKWKGRAGALAEQLGELGVQISFTSDRGYAIGPIPPQLTPPPPRVEPIYADDDGCL